MNSRGDHTHTLAARTTVSQRSAPVVSVVLPCYRAAPLARRSVAELRASLEDTALSWEIIVVDDGGGDFAPDEWHDDPRIMVLRLPHNRGKGTAVRVGMRAARGAARIFTDVDVPYGTALIPTLVSYLLDRRFHVVIGDRTLPSSTYRVLLAWPRRLASVVFTRFVGTVVTGGFFDTQCGLKAVRGDVADDLFRILHIERFAFDVELIYVCLKHRLDIKRVPVRLMRNETSSVRVARDSLRGFIDVCRIRWNQLRGRYRSAALQSIAQRDVEAMFAEAERRHRGVAV